MRTVFKLALSIVVVLSPMILLAQPGNPGGPGAPGAPIDGGIAMVVAGGIALGVNEIRKRRKK